MQLSCINTIKWKLPSELLLNNIQMPFGRNMLVFFQEKGMCELEKRKINNIRSRDNELSKLGFVSINLDND